MESRIYDILTDLLRDDITKGEAIEKLFVLCDVSQKRELLIDFMNKTQGNLIWGWNVDDSEKLADEYLKGNL